MTQDLDHDEDHDRGLAFDLSTLVHRRQALKFLAGMSVVTVAAACGAKGSSDSSSSSTSSTLLDVVIVRGRLVVDDERRRGRHDRDPGGDRRPLPGRRHERAERADRERHRAQRHPHELRRRERYRGRRSHHDRPDRARQRDGRRPQRRRRVRVALRPGGPVLDVHAGRRGRELPAGRAGGRRQRDASTFTSIFPAAYSGRWPHIHFEVYPSLSEATSAGSPITDFATRAAARRVRNRVCDRRLPRERRGTCRRRRSTPTWCSATGTRQQLATVTGSVDDGYTVALNVPV